MTFGTNRLQYAGVVKDGMNGTDARFNALRGRDVYSAKML